MSSIQKNRKDGVFFPANGLVNQLLRETHCRRITFSFRLFCFAAQIKSQRHTKNRTTRNIKISGNRNDARKRLNYLASIGILVRSNTNAETPGARAFTLPSKLSRYAIDLTFLDATNFCCPSRRILLNVLCEFVVSIAPLIDKVMINQIFTAKNM